MRPNEREEEKQRRAKFKQAAVAEDEKSIAPLREKYPYFDFNSPEGDPRDYPDTFIQAKDYAKQFPGCKLARLGRTSTADQDIDSQNQGMKLEAISLGLNVYRRSFLEHGVDGKCLDAENRKVLNDLAKFCDENDCDVLVTTPTRLIRSVVYSSKQNPTAKATDQQLAMIAKIFKGHKIVVLAPLTNSPVQDEIYLKRMYERVRCCRSDYHTKKVSRQKRKEACLPIAEQLREQHFSLQEISREIFQTTGHTVSKMALANWLK